MFSGPAQVLALCLSQANASQTLLPIILALVLIEASEDANYHLSHRRARVNPLVKGAKVRAAAVELLYQLNYVHGVAP